VETEAAAEVRALEVLGEDDIEEDFSLSVDGANDEEEPSDATETGTVAMVLRVKTPLTLIAAPSILTNCYAAKTHFKTFQIRGQFQEEEPEAFEEVCKSSSSPQVARVSASTSIAIWSYRACSSKEIRTSTMITSSANMSAAQGMSNTSKRAQMSQGSTLPEHDMRIRRRRYSRHTQACTDCHS
jgi:hypothetical protein